VIAPLLRAESIKLRGRSAFTIPVLSFAGFLGVVLTVRIVAARQPNTNMDFEAPGIWSELNDSIAQMIVFFAMITLINLVAAEYTWKTARQNVIDGLSRDQWFLGKLLLTPLIALLFFVLAYTMISLAVVGFAERAADAPIIQANQLKMMGGVLVAALGLCSLALFFAFLTRSAGAAIASVLAYFTLVEGAIRLSLMQINEDWEKYANYLPVQTFGALTQPQQWDTALAAMVRMRRPLPDTQILLALAVVYIVVLWVASYLLVRRRDL
jgi:ABC-2 type transport system permease protein